DVIIFGCTGFLGCAESIKAHLASRNLNVPVIDPVPLTMITAASLARMGLTNSKKAYAPPRRKEIKGFNIPLAPHAIAG
ncbi:MAG: hypothetical protein KDA48_10620, partial [Amphiplicatus sp.]|nr:hypothetical protein [Amphiplicatus sp.]